MTDSDPKNEMTDIDPKNEMTDAMVRTPFFLSHGIEVSFSLPATEDTMFEPLMFTQVDKKPGK